MALPAPNTPWPPLDYAEVIADTNLAQAWWIGEHAQLGLQSGSSARPAQYAGGIVGFGARLWWGNPPQDGHENARRLHIPIAADLVSTAASVLLPDPASFMLATRDGVKLGNDQAQRRLDLALNTPEHHGRMLAAVESASALGGVYPRVVWNKDVADHAWIDYVDADQAIPEFTYGKLSAVTFWRVVEDDGRMVVRHFERYEPGRIVHALYVGDIGNVGHRYDLGAHHETRGIADIVDDEGAIPTGTQLLAADYIPNALPNPKWRTRGRLRYLGRSDLTDPAVIGLMDAIDETYSSLSRDIRLAKARLVVSEQLLDRRGAGKSARFDPDHEVYAAVGGPPTDTPIIEAHQFDIRVEEHLRTADAYLRQILMRVGYDPSSFGLPDEGAAMTATEAGIKDRRNVSTNKARSGLWKGGHTKVTQALVEIDAAVFRTGAQIGEPVEVTWPAAGRETTGQRAQTVQLLEAARAVSVETKVAMLWPEWDEDRRAEEVERIKAEQASAGDPFAIGADMPIGGPVQITDPLTDEDPDELEAIDPDDDEYELPAAA